MLKFHLFRTTDYEMVVPSRIAQVLFSPAFIYKRTMRSEKKDVQSKALYPLLLGFLNDFTKLNPYITTTSYLGLVLKQIKPW